MKIVKLVLIGFTTTLLRAMLQAIIPEGQKTVLEPSMFVNNGSMPFVFMIYGTIAYGIIAAIFLVLHENMSGNRIMKGLKFGILYSLLWIAYLFEPLPHVAMIDRITYSIADSIALLVMGVLLGKFIAISSPIRKCGTTKHSLFNIGLVTTLFLVGRIIQYTIFNTYSSFIKSPIPSLAWVIGTGIVIGLVFDYINPLIDNKNIVAKSFVFGGITFGINLFAFNFFMPIVFSVGISDLFIRTILDIIFVTIGACIANRIENKKLLNSRKIRVSSNSSNLI